MTPAERKRRYRERHPERVREQNRRWRQDNPEKKQAANAAWRESNPKKPVDPDQQRAYSARWYRDNRERRNAAAAAWRRANPERQSEYQKRRRARRNGSEPDLTEEQWLEVVAEFDGRCAYCGGEGSIELEHVVPLARGGRHTRLNVVPACRKCNASKGAKLLAEWLGFV